MMRAWTDLKSPLQTFLLARNEDTDWIQAIHDGRDDYAKRRESLLRYIKNPEALTELSVDPLADDPNVGLKFFNPICLTN